MRIGFLITVRLKSTRLPKKAILEIDGREIIAWMIDRIKMCDLMDEIVLATSIDPQDEPICEIAKREGVKCFRGSKLDVLDRLYQAALAFDLDYIINITADCPLVAYDFIDNIIDTYEKTDADLVTSFKLPHGFYSYGIKVSALKKVLEIKGDEDTEVWGKYFTETGLFKVVDISVPEEYQRENYRLSLDYPDDYEFFKAVFRGMGNETYRKSSKEILEFLDNHPEIVKINQYCEEIYKKRLEEQARLVLKYGFFQDIL